MRQDLTPETVAAPKCARELSDRELEQVAGGIGKKNKGGGDQASGGNCAGGNCGGGGCAGGHC
jgi:hypothetical protein